MAGAYALVTQACGRGISVATQSAARRKPNVLFIAIDEADLERAILERLGARPREVEEYYVRREAIDARKPGAIRVVYVIDVAAALAASRRAPNDPITPTFNAPLTLGRASCRAFPPFRYTSRSRDQGAAVSTVSTRMPWSTKESRR